MDERENRLSIASVKALLLTQFNLKTTSCEDFHKIVIKDEQLLAISGSKNLEDANDDGIDFHVSTCDTKNIRHLKKQLRGNTRKVVVNEIKCKSTYMWRRQKADEVMGFGDDEPADLPKKMH
ncbi:hypothetical protein EVAR_10257_1 [Eumeta japonica]|uniref:Uncharacterized protein n=1 Tax=Eumeta variegata TaxID=151549 RepID=A0A4C1TES5_EUMVA|nr:hypothetical protein EVAR_10257_1 [Eumeta japonica]